MRGPWGSKRWEINLRQNKIWWRKLIKKTTHNSVFHFSVAWYIEYEKIICSWCGDTLPSSYHSKAEADKSLWVYGLPGINKEFKDSLDYKERSLHQNQR